MSACASGPRTGLRRRTSGAVAATVLGLSALTGCSATSDDAVAGDPGGGRDPQPSESVKEVSKARLDTNLPRRGRVSVDTLVRVSATDGTLERVRVTAGEDALPGDVVRNGTAWRASERLEPGTTYEVRGVAVDADGLRRRLHQQFRTEQLTLDEQTYASIAPLDGETVGVGMPVIVKFDVPVTNHAEVEKHLRVEAKPVQKGSWYWISDYEVHWRPKQYWKAGTDVTVVADVNGVDAGNGIYGQLDRTTSFHVGHRLIMKVDLASHEMRVVQDGTRLRTIPVTAGKDGFTTRSGTKVIIEKFRTKRMDAATTGISRDDPEYYNIADVEYAQRVTYSGEFLHAAPWSVGSQGSANVSHGCVGMSTADAAWLYSLTRRGDVVEVEGSDRPMELTNGFGDWNLAWSDYRAGSALH
jgi:lipoprotein-anchoring transpeptidase ErfK/SrfK